MSKLNKTPYLRSDAFKQKNTISSDDKAEVTLHRNFSLSSQGDKTNTGNFDLYRVFQSICNSYRLDVEKTMQIVNFGELLKLCTR